MQVAIEVKIILTARQNVIQLHWPGDEKFLLF